MNVEIGQRFGRLTVTAITPGRKDGHIRVGVACDCGTIKSAQLNHLQSGDTKSCGCLGRENMIKASTTHGLRHHHLYGMWCAIKRRCFNRNAVEWERYGGKGITMCERWRYDFAAFLADMGDRPTQKHQIERINNAGNYEPGNCKWATAKEQANNRNPRRWQKRPA